MPNRDLYFALCVSSSAVITFELMNFSRRVYRHHAHSSLCNVNRIKYVLNSDVALLERFQHMNKILTIATSVKANLYCQLYITNYFWLIFFCFSKRFFEKHTKKIVNDVYCMERVHEITIFQNKIRSGWILFTKLLVKCVMAWKLFISN